MALYEKTRAKSILADKNKIKEIVSGTLNQMAEIVGSTLGPGGRTVIIERDGLSPLLTKDGVTVARSLGVDNAEANVIIEAAKEICLNTAKQAGDGTTTAIVLANALTKHGQEFLTNNPKYNAQRMVSELNNAYKTIVLPFLKEHAKPVKEDKDLVFVATISANGDKEIAQAAVDAVMAAGDDGHVLIEEAQGNQLRVEVMDGFIVPTGLRELKAIGKAFINDKANQQVRMDKGLIFLYDGTINDLKVPAAIQQAVESTEFYGQPIVVFAHDFSDVVMEKFAATTKGGYTVVPMKTVRTGLANSASMFLQDLAAYSNGNVYDPGTIDRFIEDDEEGGFGHFETAKINMYETFITAIGDEEKIDSRVNELKSILDICKNDHDRMHLKSHIARLTGGISTIWVGGGSELEAREKKARAEDAVEAVKSAIEEGIIPGGCGVHLVLADMLANHPQKKESWIIMTKALMAPFQLLLSNCGEDINDVWSAIEQHVTKRNSPPVVIFDADQHILVDPIEAGIIEPAKVCRVSLGNALSVASLLITLGGLVVVPRDRGLESQLELGKQAFRDMMDGASGLVGQE
jgi:chaperonin GroEL